MKNTKPLLIVTLFCFIISSCHKQWYDPNYKGQNNYRNVYIVDTIDIISPIIIVKKGGGGSFVLSEETFKKNKLDENIINLPDVFIQGHDFYNDLEISQMKRFIYEDSQCGSENQHNRENKNFWVYKYKSKSVRFILELQNANHYNRITNSYASYIINSINPKNTYFKVVYPLCE